MRVSQDVRSDEGPLTDRLLELTAAVTRYDLVLAAIPLAFVFGAVAGATVEATKLGLQAGSVGALAAVAYALFGDPPTGDGPNSGRAV
ncbi:hypothetical protein [Halospeciosus flavus]|uniref:Uncharacterized protein n=1 Tax=Halospeciosus flavus TaxID=3032283 RepID=A0ABD5Z850_9EURY|nr:hypothetical protein [Halospeciosus flavus]